MISLDITILLIVHFVDWNVGRWVLLIVFPSRRRHNGKRARLSLQCPWSDALRLDISIISISSWFDTESKWIDENHLLMVWMIVMMMMMMVMKKQIIIITTVRVTAHTHISFSRSIYYVFLIRNHDHCCVFFHLLLWLAWQKIILILQC